MTRAAYDVKEEYLGDGTLAVYTFDFKIEAKAQLLVIEIDDTGVETQRVLGDDLTYLSSVVFDSVDGAGTVTLAANLPVNYRLILLLANDEPTQPFRFRNTGEFTLRTIEKGLDFLGGAIQRLAYRAERALRIHEGDDISAFDPRFPIGVADAKERYLRINDDGDGLEFGFTLDELADLIFPASPDAGQIIQYNGSDWIKSWYGGGGFNVQATENIAAGATVTLGAHSQQIVNIQGDGAAVTTALAPFSITPTGGAMIILMGLSASNTVKIPYADVAGGCMLNGDCYLGLNDTLTLVYNSAILRYVEVSRN